MKNEAKIDAKFESNSGRKQKRSPTSKKIGHKHVKIRKSEVEKEKIAILKKNKRIDEMFKKINLRRDSSRENKYLENRNLQGDEKDENDE